MAPERVLLLRFVVKELLLSSPSPETLLKNFCPNSQRKMFPNTNLYLKGSQIQITYIWKSMKCKQTTDCKQTVGLRAICNNYSKNFNCF